MDYNSGEITLSGNVNSHNNMYRCSKNTHAVHQAPSHNLIQRLCFSKKQIPNAIVKKKIQTQQFY
jgi:hypothetical protein